MSNKELKYLVKKYHDALKDNNIEEQINSLLQISQYYFNRQDFNKSRINLLKILDLDENYININYYVALIEIEEGNLKKAERFLKKELEINPLNSSAKTLLSKLKINNNFPIITLILVFLNSIVFYFNYPQISKINLIKYALISKHITFSKIITSLFFHFNLLHFISNIFILLLLGLILEKQIGSLKFLFIFLISGILGNFFQAIIYPNAFVLGASAGIFGIVGSLIIVKPTLELRILGFIKMPLIIFFSAYFIFANILMNSFTIPGISVGDLAHFIGFFIGILLTGILYSERVEVFYNWIIITLGFYLINNGILLVVNKKLIFGLDLLIQLFFYIILGFILVYYGYKLLKYVNLEEGMNRENE